MSGSVNGRNVLNVVLEFIPVVEGIVVPVDVSVDDVGSSSVVDAVEVLPVGGIVDVGLGEVVVKSKFIGGSVESVIRESGVGVAGDVVGSGDITSGDVPPEVGVELVVDVKFDSGEAVVRAQGGVGESIVVELIVAGSVEVVVYGVLSAMLEVEPLDIVDSGLVVVVELVPSVGKVIIA